MIKIIPVTSRDQWMLEDTVLPLTQSYFYGEIQASLGRQVLRFKIYNGDRVIGLAECVVYPLVRGRSYLYVPYGPVLTQFDEDISRSLRDFFQSLASKYNLVFSRFDITGVLPQDVMKFASGYTLPHESSHFGAYFQPRLEWYTSIAEPDEAILTAMHQKTRYSVRYAERKGVEIRLYTTGLREHLDSFIMLMKTTASRNGFSLHDDAYYRTYFDTIEKFKNGFLAEAWYQGELLASHLLVLEGDTLHYVFGSSSNEHREVCAPYLLHFKSMIAGRNMGASFYNFGAISPDGLHYKSLGDFKQKFGGSSREHGPYLDIVSNKFWYYIYIVRKYINYIFRKS